MTDDQGSTNYPHLRAVQRVVWNKDCTLSGHARSIAAYLLNRMHANYEGAFPSVDRTADDMGFGRDTVIKYTKELIDSGLFERKAGRKGMYTYRVKDIDQLVALMDAKMEEWTKQLWAGLASKQLNGGSGRPVDGTDRSTAPTATGRRRRPQPVDGADTERHRGKGQLTGQVEGQPTAGQPLSSPQSLQADDSSLSVTQEGAGLQMQEPEVVEFGQGIPWVDERDVPPGTGYRPGVYFDAPTGKLSLVSHERGRAFYRSLRDDGFTPEQIKLGLMAACTKAPAVRARAGGYEALVRTYVGYAQEREKTHQQAAQARQTAFEKPKAFRI